MRHRTVSDYFGEIFSGKVRKIAVNANLGCPNRDGTIGREGCIYCNNAAFNPGYAFGADGNITAQLHAGVKFSAAKGEVAGYLPYFQTYSNTYGDSGRLIRLYEEALAFPGTKGLVIGTRPDCLDAELMDYFQDSFSSRNNGKPFLLIEIGIESTLNRTLQLIGRGHTYECAEKAIRELSDRGIAVGAHLILGLPGETEEDFAHHIRRINDLPVKTLKLHQLQVIRGTALEKMYTDNPDSLKLFTASQYASLLSELIPVIREDIALDRLVSQTPQSLLVAPRWGIKPGEFEKLLEKFV